MSRRRGRLRAFFTEHAWVDSLLSVLVLLIAFQTLPEDFANIVERQEVFLATLATVAGVVLAAATFAFTMIIQSPSQLLQRVRAKFSNVFVRVWIHILSATLVACLVSASLLLAPPSRSVVTIGLALLVLVLLSSARTIWWLRFLLLFEEREDRHPEVYEFPNRTNPEQSAPC